MGSSTSKEDASRGPDGQQPHGPGGSQTSSLSYWSIMRQGYDELVNAIIRPPRAEYDIDRLGPSQFTFCGKTFRRTDLTLVNQRGLALQCSHWEPVDRPADELPAVVFMHGNSSARLEGLNQLSVCLGYGMTLFAFDCAGSGKSEGEYVSLGWFERDDLRVVVDHLRGSGSVSKIAVWGRSMGAVTGLLYQVQDAELLGEGRASVDAMVLDSPFADFCQLAEELVAKGRDRGVIVPSMVTRMALSMLATSVKSVAGFDIHDLAAIKVVRKCTLPALFVCAKRDDFIGTHHAQSLHDEYGGERKFIIVAEGDHNTLRSSQSMLAVGSFLQRELQVPKSWMRVEAVPSFATVPWRLVNNHSNNTSAAAVLAADEAYDMNSRRDQGVGFSRDKVNAVHRKIDAAMSEMGYGGGNNKKKKHNDKTNDSPMSRSRRLLNDDAMHNSDEGDLLHTQTSYSRPRDGATAATLEERQWCLDQAHYYCNRGNALEEAGKMDAAIRAYRAAITYHSEYPDAHYNLGIALKNRGQVEEAIKEYSKTVAFKPDHADAHNNLGVALEESGDADAAVDSYRRAIEHNAEHSEAHCNLADALQSVGRIEEAIEEYHVAIAQNPGDSDTINNLGVALEACGRVKDAIAAYSTAVANKPDHWDAQCNLADALQLHGELDRAVQVYGFILKYNPKNAQIASSLGNVLHAKEKHAEALAAYSLAVEENPGDTITHNNMGIVLQSMGDVPRAIDAYRNALRHDPSYAIAHYNLGVALQSQKRLTEAIESYRTAVFHRKTYADAYNNMGYALQQLGDLDGAVESYRAAVAIRPDFASAVANLKHALADIQSSVPVASQKPVSLKPYSSSSSSSNSSSSFSTSASTSAGSTAKKSIAAKSVVLVGSSAAGVSAASVSDAAPATRHHHPNKEQHQATSSSSSSSRAASSDIESTSSLSTTSAKASSGSSSAASSSSLAVHRQHASERAETPPPPSSSREVDFVLSPEAIKSRETGSNGGGARNKPQAPTTIVLTKADDTPVSSPTAATSDTLNWPRASLESSRDQSASDWSDGARDSRTSRASSLRFNEAADARGAPSSKHKHRGVLPGSATAPGSFLTSGATRHGKNNKTGRGSHGDKERTHSSSGAFSFSSHYSKKKSTKAASGGSSSSSSSSMFGSFLSSGPWSFFSSSSSSSSSSS